MQIAHVCVPLFIQILIGALVEHPEVILDLLEWRMESFPHAHLPAGHVHVITGHIILNSPSLVSLVLLGDLVQVLLQQLVLHVETIMLHLVSQVGARLRLADGERLDFRLGVHLAGLFAHRAARVRLVQSERSQHFGVGGGARRRLQLIGRVYVGRERLQIATRVSVHGVVGSVVGEAALLCGRQVGQRRFFTAVLGVQVVDHRLVVVHGVAVVGVVGQWRFVPALERFQGDRLFHLEVGHGWFPSAFGHFVSLVLALEGDHLGGGGTTD